MASKSRREISVRDRFCGDSLESTTKKFNSINQFGVVARCRDASFRRHSHTAPFYIYSYRGFLTQLRRKYVAIEPESFSLWKIFSFDFCQRREVDSIKDCLTGSQDVTPVILDRLCFSA